MQEFAFDNPGFSLFLGLLALLVAVSVLVFFRDVFLQRRHAIQHNFPVVGHLRYMLERIGPELRQYWVANDKEERPFNRSERTWVYASAKGENNAFGFGTSEEIDELGYPIVKHATFPFPDDEAVVLDGDPSLVPCLKIIGEHRRRPWRPQSIVNVSAMSYGSLGRRATEAINRGCAKARAYHNTGEGGVCEHHGHGAEIVWQLGTGYFGARSPEGTFSLEIFKDKIETHPHIRAIEVKLSQGAKPGKGGILPGAKVTPEIARIRGIEVGKTCYSPNHHTAFRSVDELIDFVEQLSDTSGLPVGIKGAVGKLDFWHTLAERMRARGEGPDYIQIDGGEGGTGAAPLAFSDHVSLPFNIAFARVYKIFQHADALGRIVWVGSGKLGFPDRAVVALAMGADLIAIAREPMMSIGCIQAQKCHTGYCPAGVATHNPWLQAGIDIEDKAERLARYLRQFRKELLSLAHASGYEHPGLFCGDDIELATGANRFETLTSVLGYQCAPVPFEAFSALGPVEIKLASK